MATTAAVGALGSGDEDADLAMARRRVRQEAASTRGRRRLQRALVAHVRCSIICRILSVVRKLGNTTEVRGLL